MAPLFLSTPTPFRMSSIQQQIDELREQKENLSERIAELEDTMRWEKEKDVRCAQLQHKEDLENIERLRTDTPLVTSNPALMKHLERLVTWGGGTPHSQGRAWAFCENWQTSMLNVNNGISMPALSGATWPDGALSMSGVFSYSSFYKDGSSGINYPKGTMIDFDLLYRDGRGRLRKGLVLKEGAILQLVPEKKVYTSLGEWIAGLAQPTFGAVRVRLPDPRTRHEKAQEELSKLGSFEEKVAYLMSTYNLKQRVKFGYSPKELYEQAQVHRDTKKNVIKERLAGFDLSAPEAGQLLEIYGRHLKNAEVFKQQAFKFMQSRPEKERDTRPISFHNRWHSCLVARDGGALTTHGGIVYHDSSPTGMAPHPLPPEGQSKVFLMWRGKQIAFNV